MEKGSKVSGESELLKKAIGVAIWQSEYQKFSHFSECKAQGHQHKIWTVFFKHDKDKTQTSH